MSILSRYICRTFKRGDDKRDAGLTTPDYVTRYDDLQYGPDPKWNVLDVYRPKDAEGKLPVIVSVHGGGWVYGDKELYQYYCMSLTQFGFAVVNFTYRLAPEFKYPASMEDTVSVFRWVKEHADEYGLDADRVCAVGDSAGGHMLSLYSCLCADAAFAEASGFALDASMMPKAVGLNCGVYKMEKKGMFDLTSMLMRDVLPHKGTAEEMLAISPIDHLNGKFPPAYVMTAEGDFLAPHATMMADQLKELGVRTVYRYYGDKDHVLGHVFHVNMKLPEAYTCNKDECGFFRDVLEETAEN